MSDFDLSTPAPLPEPDLPPNSPEAEMGWLGCMIQDANVAMDGCGWLTEEHFYSLDHLVLFGVLREMYAESRPIDLVTVQIHLQRKRLLEAAGGFEILSKCLETAPSPANAPYYAGILREKWALREALEAARGVLEGAKVSQDPLAFVRAARAKFEALAQEMEDLGEIQSIHGKEAAEILVADANDHFSRAGKPPEIAYGLKDLDRVTGGLHLGEMTIVGARPSVGKTALLITFAKHIAQDGLVPTLFITLESQPKAIIRRLSCGSAEHSLGSYRRGEFRDRDFPRHTAEAVRLKNSPLYFVGQDPKRPRTVDDLRALIRYHVRKYGVKVVLIDYLGKIKPSGRAREKVSYEIGDITSSLHAESEGSNVAIILAVQLNRDAEDKKAFSDKRKSQSGDEDDTVDPYGAVPLIVHIADSGQIERDADTIILIQRNRHRKAGPARLIVPKQRDGETDAVECWYIGRYTRFYDKNRGAYEDLSDSMEGHPA